MYLFFVGFFILCCEIKELVVELLKSVCKYIFNILPNYIV